MSGYVPKRVRNANIRLTSNQRGLKLQGLVPSIGQGRVLNRYTKSRVKSGVVVDAFPTGYRCINGVDPITASPHALECNCEYIRDNTNAAIIVPPAPLSQALAGGVGRINAPRFNCGSTCEGDPYSHSHFYPPINPHPQPPHSYPPVPPEPIPRLPSNFRLTISHYGVPGIFNAYSSEESFKKYCRAYLNFIYNKGKEGIEIDRVFFCIPGNPGPAYNPVPLKINGFLNSTTSAFNSNTTTETDGFNRAAFALSKIEGGIIKPAEPWVYTHFVKHIIDYNVNKKWVGKIKNVEVGFTFYHGGDKANGDGYYDFVSNSGNTNNWTQFIQSGSDLELPSGSITSLSWNQLSNPTGNDFSTPRNNIAQEFAYMNRINFLLSQEYPSPNIINRVSHCTWDQEGNIFPSDNTIDNLWNKYLGYGTYSNLPPRWSSTSVGNMNRLGQQAIGPDRYYREIYDLFDYSKPSSNETNLCSGSGGGREGRRSPAKNSYLNIFSGSETKADGSVETNSPLYTIGGWDVIGLAPDGFYPSACGSQGGLNAAVISKKYQGDNLCNDPITCGNGSGPNGRYAVAPDPLSQYYWNLQAAAGTGGSKYLFAKYGLTNGPHGDTSYPAFGTLKTGTPAYNKSLEFALELMTSTGWMNFFGVGRLNNADWKKYTFTNTGSDTGSGVVLMFSCQSRFNSAGGGTAASLATGEYSIAECGGEESFGSWTWYEFKTFLEAVVKQLNKLFPGFGDETHPVQLGLYEFNYIPTEWLKPGPF